MTFIPNLQTDVGIDAGGRERISQQFTLFDGKIIGSDDLDLWDNQGTGTAIYGNNKIAMSTIAGQFMVRSGRQFHLYNSGKSVQAEISFDSFGTTTGLTKRFGYFSSSITSPFTTILDGFFIDNTNNTISLQAFRNGVQTFNIPIANWNGIDLTGHNWNNFNVVMFDFLWLGGTALRVFIKTANGFELAHTQHWAPNNIDTFIGSPHQAIRYEIRSTTGTGTFNSICSQVSTEGSTNNIGSSLGVFNSTVLATNTIGTIYALKGIKKTQTFRYSPIQLISASIINKNNNDKGIFCLIENPTLSTPLTYVTNEKILEGTAITGTTITPGTGRVLTCNASSISSKLIGLDNNNLSFIGYSLTGISDEYILAYMPITATQSVAGIMEVKIH